MRTGACRIDGSRLPRDGRPGELMWLPTDGTSSARLKPCCAARPQLTWRAARRREILFVEMGSKVTIGFMKACSAFYSCMHNA